MKSCDLRVCPRWVPLKGMGQKGICTSSGCNRGGFGLNDAAVLTAAIAGAVAPADLAGTDVPAVARMEFPAVAEDLSLADDAGGGGSLVIHVSEPLRTAAEADPLIDVGKTSSVALRKPMGLPGSEALSGCEEGGSSVDIVTVPALIELISADSSPLTVGNLI